MKKSIIIPVLLLLVMFGFSCKKEVREVPREGAVNFLTGDVFLVQKGKKTKANVGDSVKTGMKIITGNNAMVDIYFGENAIKVLSNSVVEVKNLVTVIADNGEKTELYLERGKLFSKVAKKLQKQDSYKVTTPTTIAAVRGTNFLVSEEGKKGNVACLNGLVDVLNKSMSGKQSGAAQVGDGQEVIVEEGKELSVKDLSDENKKAMQDILGDIRDIQKDIWRQFEEEKARIQKFVDDQKQENKEMIEQQIREDQENVNKQIEGDKENIRQITGDAESTMKDIKGSTKGTASDAQSAVEAQKKSSVKDGAALPSMKID